MSAAKIFTKSPFAALRFARVLFALVLGLTVLSGTFSANSAGAAGSGQIGRFVAPAAGICNYGSSHIFSVRVPAPQVFARNTTSVNDVQRVGYVVDLVRLNADGSITNVGSSGARFGTASETQSAAFGSHTFEGVRGLGPGIYAVSVTFVWYEAANPQIVQGITQQLLGTYKLTQLRTNAAPLLVQTVSGGCPSLRPF
jgi:hypothetical protein